MSETLSNGTEGYLADVDYEILQGLINEEVACQMRLVRLAGIDSDEGRFRLGYVDGLVDMQRVAAASPEDQALLSVVRTGLRMAELTHAQEPPIEATPRSALSL